MPRAACRKSGWRQVAVASSAAGSHSRPRARQRAACFKVCAHPPAHAKQGKDVHPLPLASSHALSHCSSVRLEQIEDCACANATSKALTRTRKKVENCMMIEGGVVVQVAWSRVVQQRASPTFQPSHNSDFVLDCNYCSVLALSSFMKENIATNVTQNTGVQFQNAAQ